MKVHRKNSSSVIDRLVLPYGCLLLICLAGIHVTDALPVCYGELDLIFVIDASYSIIDHDFAMVCEFVVQLYADVLQFMGYNVRVGAILYATDVYDDIIHLTDDQTKVMAQILNFKRNPRSVSTNTAAALQRFLKMKIEEGNPDATTVGVLITDGKSNDPAATTTVAADIKSDGKIEMVAIGFGNEENVDLYELSNIATKPKNVIISSEVESYDFRNNVLFQVCKATQEKKGPLPVDRASLAMDVIFLLDESSAVLTQDFGISKEFVKSIMNTFEISTSLARVGIIKYGTASLASPHLIDLTQYDNQEDLFAAIDNMNLNTLNSAGHNLAAAFNRVKSFIGASPNPARPVIVVVMTAQMTADGAAAIAAASDLKARKDVNVYMLLLAIGTDTDAWKSERSQIMTSSATSFHTANFLGISGTDQDSIDFIQGIRNVIYSIGSGTFTTTGPGAVSRWSAAMDIVFAIDGSMKMRANVEFMIVKFIMKQLIDQFQVSGATGRVAIIIYDASGAYSILSFTDYSGRADLEAKIDNLKLIRRTESADTAIGISVGRGLFTANYRWPITKILFLVTLSTSPYQLLAEAEARQAAKEGIQIIQLAVGNNVQTFDSVDGSVISTSLAYMASDEVITRLKDEVQNATKTVKAAGTYYPWRTSFDLILLVHDESGRADSDAVKVFLQEFVSSFTIGPNDVRVGVITFGASVHSGVGKRIDLGHNLYLGSLIVDILQLSFVPSGGPNVYAALQAALAMLGTFGSADGRPRIIMQLLQGDITLTQDLLNLAEQAKKADPNVMIASMGIGPESKSEKLGTISYNKELSFYFPSWSSVGMTTGMSAAMMALSLNQFKPMVFADILRLPVTCDKRSSIVFLVDASDSMSTVIDKAKVFTAALMSGFKIPDVKIGVIGYSTEVLDATIIQLGQFSTYIELYLYFMENMQQDPFLQKTGTDAAIARARLMLAAEPADAEKIIVCLTDGNSDNQQQTEVQANEARADGIEVVAVGLRGSSTPFVNELNSIAGNIEDNMFLVSEDALGLSSMLEQIQTRICILTRKDCLAGNYRDPETLECKPCELGTYQSEIEKLFCVSCADGLSTTITGATSDTQCVVNCKPGTFNNGGTCEQCALGSYQPASGQTSCISCPADRPITDLKGSISDNDCKRDSVVCTERMDLVLIVDCTSSIQTHNFNYLKAFLANFLNFLDIGLDKTRVSIVPIGKETVPEEVVSLIASTDTFTLMTAIMNLPFGADYTNTASAINMGHLELDKNGRPDVSKVIFVITDGMSMSPSETLYQAVLATQKGYIMVALGIGTSSTSYFKPELDGIAGDRVLVHENFVTLPDQDFSRDICDAAKAWVPPAPTSTDVCAIEMDIAIIMDLSDSFLSGQIDVMKAQMIEFVDSLDLLKVRVAVVGYSYDVHGTDIQPLTSNFMTIRSAIMRQTQDFYAKQGLYGTNTAAALRSAKTQLEARKKDILKTILLITDGISTSPADTVKAANEVEQAGIYAVCVGVGQAYVEELKVIGTTGADSVLKLNSLLDLRKNVIKDKVCPENFACTYPLEITFIWYNAASDDKIAEFSSDLSNRFGHVRASIIKVGPVLPDLPSLAEAITKATELLISDTTVDTIKNIAIFTDRSLTEITNIEALQTAVNNAKSKGIKITIIYFGSGPSSAWEPYALSSTSVFNTNKFDETADAWRIQRSLCEEPCPSGSEFEMDGACELCALNEYRKREESYMCIPCPEGSLTSETGAESPLDCDIIKKCDIPMDLVYIVDTSDSIQVADFALLKAYLINLNTRFDIGLTDLKTRAALIEIGEETTPDDMSQLSDSDTDISVNLRIMRMERGAQLTNTASALHRLTDQLTNYGRDKEFFPHVALMIVDGTSVNSFKTKLEASRAHGAGIHIVVAAIGSSVSTEEIQAVASDAQSVFTFDTFTELHKSNAIAAQLCEAARQYKPPVDPTEPSVDIIGDCKSNMDIVFVVDASESISTVDFARVQAFLINFVERLDIGVQKIRIGIISYAQTVNTVAMFSLSEGVSKLKVISGVMRQTLTTAGSGTNTAAALEEMNKMFTQQGRTKSPHVAIVITDGASDDMVQTLAKAQAAKNNGIHLVTIGFGQVFQTELYSMATDPGSVLIVTFIQELTTEDLLGVSCAHDYKCDSPMDIVVVWDLEDFDSISRASSFVSDMESKFSNSRVQSVFIDHIATLLPAVSEARSKLQTGETNTAASRIIVIITDKTIAASMKTQVTNELAQIKKTGIMVAVIDAAAVPNDLAAMASNNKLHFVTSKFDILPYNLVIKRSLCIKPCTSGQEVSLTGDSCTDCTIGTYRDATASFMCVDCPNNLVTLATKSTDVEDCLIGACVSKMDVVFVIDASKSILNYQFNQMRAFLVETIAKFDIGPHRVGFVPFSKEVFLSQVFDLDMSTDKQAVINYLLMTMSQDDIGYGTNTARAIDVAKDMIVAQRRPDAFQVMVVMTDGASSNMYRTLEEASQAQQQIIRLYSVGLGSNVFVTELQGISSDGQSILIIDSFLTLASKRNFIDDICEDEYICPEGMDITIVEDNSGPAIADPDFTIQATNFVNRLNSPVFPAASVTRKVFAGHTELVAALSVFPPSNPQRTKVFVIITKMDLVDSGVQQQVNQLRAAGAVVTVVNANPALQDLLFLNTVSDPRLLFATENFGKNPDLRVIERKLCIPPCTSGKERDTKGNCRSCELGKYRVATQTHICTDCDPGETTVTSGANSDSLCVPDCGPGTYTDGTTCKECEQGFFQPLRLQTTCEKCPDGKTTSTTGTMLQTECIADCPAGKKRQPDESECTACPVNTYQPSSLQTTCLQCPGQLITDSDTSTSLSDCHDLCGVPMDVLFLVDSSTSISSLEYSLIQGFLVTNILRFKVSQTDTRFGIIPFAHNVLTSPQLKFSQSVDADAAVRVATRLIQGQQHGTNTAAAFRAAVQMFAAEGRQGVPHVIFVITDGISDNMQQTVDAANLAKRNFIHVYSLGVGQRFFEPELKAIATDKQSLILEPSFMKLISRDILPVICQSDFTCTQPMDLYLVQDYDDNPTVDAKFDRFKDYIDSKFTSGRSFVENKKTLKSNLEQIANRQNGPSSNPDATKVAIIVTNKVNADVPGTKAAADDLKDLGFVVVVVYASNVQTDTSYNQIVSGPELLFYSESFDEIPYEDFILTSCCITPCGDGEERQPDGSCGPCEKGSYRTASESHVCEQCSRTQTTNAEGASSENDCVDCLPGQVRCEGQTICIDVTQVCDGNSDCPQGTDEQCNDCVAGERWDEAQSSCVDCSKGFYQPEGKQTSCIQCPEGSTTPGVGSDGQEDCSVKCDVSGQELQFPEGTCVECAKGSYRDKNLQLSCVDCPPDFTTPDSGATSKDECVPDCIAGQKYDTTIPGCVSCGPKEYQPNVYKDSCIQCPDGTATGVQGSTSSTDCKDPCEEGKQLPPGGVVTADCVDCPVNTYKSTSDTTCQNCPDGFISDPSSTSVQDCKPDCKIGEYYSKDQDDCLECNFGSYQDTPYQTECKPCPSGTSNNIQGAITIDTCTVPCHLGLYLNEAGECTKCPLGTIRDVVEDTTCTPCDAGFTTEAAGSTSCVRDCPPGTHVSNGINCVDCELGTYQSKPRQSTCDECDSWKTTTSTRADSPQLCTDLCDSGTIMTSRDPLECSLCPRNTYREKGVDASCQSCPTNYVTDNAGTGLTVQDCKPDCKAGEEFDPKILSCVPCGAGEFQNLPQQLECNKCPDGRTTVPLTGAIDISNCVYDCSPGHYWDKTTLKCVPCGKGKYQASSDADTCDTCPAGMTTKTDTAKSIADCVGDCSKGTYYEAGIQDCVNCPKGSYQDLSYQTTCKQCPPERPATLQSASTSDVQCVTPCKAGEHFPNKVCEPCPVGYYQPQPNQENCLQCVDKTTDGPGATQCIDWPCKSNQWKCTTGPCILEVERCDGNRDCPDESDEAEKCDCVAGEYWDGDLQRCEDCKRGTYQDNDDQELCKQCSPGFYTKTVAADSATDCKECEAGFQLVTGDTDCKVCPKDMYRPLGQVYCESCPTDHITTTTGSTSITDCFPDCSVGTFYDGTTCTPCLKGTYQNEAGQRECKACPQDTSTTGTGSDSINDCLDPCDAGSPLADECKPCSPGFVLREPKSSICIPDCPTGTFYQDITSSACTPCPVGYYQFQPLQNACLKCPMRTITDDTGADTVALCYDPCASGYEYNLGSETCDICEVGFYRESGTDEQCTSCTATHTTRTAGATSKEACIPNCAEGTFYTGTVCEPCPAGTYQSNKYSSKCIDCPLGTFVTGTGATSISSCQDPCAAGQEMVADGTGQKCEPCAINWIKTPPDTLCKQCQQGFVAPSPGSTQCVPDCQAGSYYDTNKAKCELCQIGTYQSNPNKYSCDKCDVGLSTLRTGSTSQTQCYDPCSSGLELQFDGTCKPCELNYYRTKDVHGQCQTCPKNLFTFFEGSISEDECMPPCNKGDYWDVDKVSCLPCAPGSYTDMSYQKECKLCGPGQTTLDDTGTTEVSGATSASQCHANCLKGTKWDSATSTCLDCDKGTYQADNYKDFCFHCLQGYTTSTTGSKSSDDCYDPCESGYTYNPQSSTGCEPCGSNRYRDRSQQHNLCINCDNGLITKSDTATSANECIPPCKPGEEWNIDVCVKCEAGTFQDKANQYDCNQCPNGFTTAATGATNLIQCVAPCSKGEQLDFMTKKCVPCPVGTYQDEEYELMCKPCGMAMTTLSPGATSPAQCIATLCPPGQWVCGAGCGTRCDTNVDCADTSDEQGCTCVPGTFYDVATGQCTPCALGTYQDETGQLSCKHCLQWEATDNTGSVSANDCKDACQSGFTLIAVGTCVECPIGSYREAESGPNCNTCPEGHTTLAAAAPDASACVPDCVPGTAFDVNNRDCPPCSLGFYQEKANQRTCDKCSPGKTTVLAGTIKASDCFDPCLDGTQLLSGTHQTDCTPCPKGTYKKAGVQTLCVSCSAGFTTSGSNSVLPTECLPDCGVGEEMNVAGTGCDPCPLGMYQDQPLQLSCKDCQYWESTLFTGSDSVDDCQDVCGDGLEVSSDKTQCVPCDLGRYRNAAIDRECIDCPPERSITLNIGSDSIDDCLYNCLPGQMYDNTEKKCVPCPKGKYQDLPFQSSCVSCPPWQTTASEGSKLVTDCVDICADGSYLAIPPDGCELCERGTYRIKGETEYCVSCRDGWTTPALGAKTAAECVPDCAGGQYWDEASDICVTCEKNTFNPDPYQETCQPCPPERPFHVDDHLSCKEDCLPGSNWNLKTKACNWCPFGQYQDVRGQPCKECGLGQTTLQMGSTDITQCVAINCKSNEYYSSFNNKCQDCPIGKIPTVDKLNCERCGPTMPFTTPDGSHCMAECQVGFFWSTTNEKCEECPLNTYQDALKQDRCKNCPVGETTQAIGSISILSCQTEFCTGGKVYSYQTKKCENCNTAVGNCVSCPPGSFKNVDKCEPCPINKYQAEWNKEQCIDCVPPLHTGGIGSDSPLDCVAEWCDPGTKKFTFPDGSHECRDCGYGKYRGDQDVDCIKCPDGKSTTTTKAVSVNDCLVVTQCQPGEFSTPTGCTDCLLNTYNDQTGVIIACTNCPAPRRTLSTGSKSVDECKLYCPAGQYRGTGDLCTPCSIGSYKEGRNEATECTKCTLDYTTPNVGTTSASECQSGICAGGFYYDFDVNRCLPCGYASYRTLNGDACVKCPTGKTTATEYADSLTDCVEIVDTCPSGQEKNPTSGQCKQCDKGKYRDAALHTKCVSCPDRFSTQFPGSKSSTFCAPATTCAEPFDFMIAVDVTNTVDGITQWLNQLIQRLAIDCKEWRLGFVIFADNVKETSTLDDCVNIRGLSQFITAEVKPVTAGSTDTAAALRRAKDILETQGRTDVRNNLLLITNNPSASIAKDEAAAVKDCGINLMFISTQPTEIQELKPSVSCWFHSKTYNNLPDVENVMCSLCPKKYLQTN